MNWNITKYRVKSFDEYLLNPIVDREPDMKKDTKKDGKGKPTKGKPC